MTENEGRTALTEEELRLLTDEQLDGAAGGNICPAGKLFLREVNMCVTEEKYRQYLAMLGKK